MSQAIGIDLGTTYSCVSYLEGNEPKVIPNLEGMQTTPSVVSFTSSGEKLIGNLALRQAITNPQNTIFAIKRLMGKKFESEEVQEARKKIPYELTEASNGDVMVQVDSNTISPQEISAMILGYLKKCAETYFGDEVTQAVITVPAHFDDHQRQATKDAAQIAGLEVLRVINEPTAASLAYGLDTKKDATIAVYDMGGGTFDITLMEINEGIFHVLGTNGNSYLGGEDFDDRIVTWLIEVFEQANGIDLSDDKLALQRIKEAAEKAKRELSFTLETEINLPFIGSDKTGSKHLKQVLTRTKLEELTRDLVLKTFPYIDQSLSDANLDAEKIDEVILVGGQTRMPLIKELITDFFKKNPIERINPDEIVAMGASIQTAIISGTLKDLVLLLDVTPLSLGIETENERFVKIIEKNTTIPTKQTMAFTTVEHDQRRVRVHVLQGESENVKENISLAVFDLVGITTAPAGVPQIDVTFEIDADGIARVSARDVATGREQSVEVRPTSGLTPEEVHGIIKRTREEESE
ncbi:MAG: molecular chaperone DnaK [Candidatus Aminicenantes bacterium]|jgi:molecular chaperone DnaK